jgi:hypothetical protein
MTNKLLAHAPYARFQTSGGAYTADSRGIIAAAATEDVIDLIRGGCIQLPAYDNYSAMIDPTASHDCTQDFSAGSRWFNTLSRCAWVCLSPAEGAAIWGLDGIVPGVGAEPSNMRTYLGGGTGTLLKSGNLDRQVGTPLAGNGADITDDVLASYTLPNSSFDALGRGLCIIAQGMTGPTNNDKRLKLWFNATIIAGVVIDGSVIADSGAWINSAAPNNNIGWQLMSNVFKFGEAGSDTQYGQGTAILGGVHCGIGSPVICSATEANATVIAVTGSSYTAGVANDLVATWFEVNAMN